MTAAKPQPQPTTDPRILRERVVMHIAQHPDNTADEISDAVRGAKTQVINTLNALRTEGLIDATRSGKPPAMRYHAAVTADELRATTENGCDPELIYRAADELERLHNERGMFYALMENAMTPWRPPDEIPPLGTLALLAVPLADNPADYALLSAYERTPDGWRNDCTGKTIAPDDIWWCTEDDLIAHLVPRVKLRSNGHG